MSDSAPLIAVVAAAFTGAQAFFQWRQFNHERRMADEEATRRLQERNTEEVRRRRGQADDEQRAFLDVWAEQFRVEQLASRWEIEDLVELSLAGLLDQRSLLPDSSSRLVASAARLSREAGFLAVTASTWAADTAREVNEFNVLVGSQVAALGVPSHVSVRRRGNPEIDHREEEIRKSVRQLALLWSDAMNHSDHAHAERPLAIRKDAKSHLAVDEENVSGVLCCRRTTGGSRTTRIV